VLIPALGRDRCLRITSIDIGLRGPIGSLVLEYSSQKYAFAGLLEQ